MGAKTATTPLVQVLGRVPLLQGLPGSDLERIAGLAKPRTVQAGEFLFREGDDGDRCFVVEEGAVEVLRERPLGDHEQLGVRRRGETVGELSLLDDAPRTVSARALEDSRLLTLARADFDGLLGGDSFATRLLRGLSRSLRTAGSPAVSGPGATRSPGRLLLEGLEPRMTPAVEGYALAGARVREGAGDSLWDAVATDDGRALLALMDVKGSGLPPAYLIGITRTLFRELGPDVPFDGILRRLNGAIFRSLVEGLDECVEVALVEVRDGTVRWSSAGEQPAVVLAADGSSRTIASHGPPLGILPHFDYGVTQVALDPGDTLLAFSDAPAALVKGAVDLARSRAVREPVQLAELLGTAIRSATGTELDVSFVIVHRGNAGAAGG